MARSVTFTITTEDYHQAQRLWLARYVRSGRYWRRIGITVVCAATILALVVGVTDGDWLLAVVTGVSGALGGVAAVMICLGIGFLRLRSRAAKMLAQHRKLRGEWKFEWSETGDDWIGERARTASDWTD